MSDQFEVWLREVCFQAPPKYAYDLAKSAYKKGMERAADIAESKFLGWDTPYIAARLGIVDAIRKEIMSNE